MYTDSLPATMNTRRERKGAVLAVDLLVAADRYGVKGLKLLAENKLCHHVAVSTVLLLLLVAEKYKCRKLKKKCLGFIGSGANARTIVAGNGFEDLARSCPSAITDVIKEILYTREITGILDSREARCKRLVNVCFYAFYFLLLFLFLVFAVFKKQ
ncbi:unnamed protein product [Urochloa humidicola]